MKQIDTGGLLFNELRKRDKYYVDKSLLIKDVLESNDSGIYLFTRPRRFGKTTNLSMLDAFLNMRYEGNTWFDDLAISDYPQFRKYKNEYPVLNINLKGSKSPTYDDFLKAMGSVILQSLKEHLYLFDYPGLTDDEKYLFDSLSRRTAEREQLRTSASDIMHILERYHGKKVVVLIDEYDRAVADSFGKESHIPVMDFLGEFMNSTLKNNSSLQLACVTGVMQIAKESMFSDLNNIKINNIFSERSDERFGFTEKEVMMVLSDYGHPEKMEEAKRWYDGYHFGNVNVYNPYSIMNYVEDGFKPKPFWSNSGGDHVFRWLLERVSSSNLSKILSLIEGGTIRVKLLPSLRYEILNSNDVSLYSLMAMSGYLKAVDTGSGDYDISIPNLEISGIVERIIDEVNPIDTDLFLEFNRAVLDCDADRMTSTLQSILLEGSYLNLNMEYSYGLILMTIMHALSKRYEVRTEYDAGNGRTDITMRPKHEGTVPMIFELKKVRSESEPDDGLREALSQIHEKRYYMGMPGKVILVGISFHLKTPRVSIEMIDNGPDGLSYRR